MYPIARRLATIFMSVMARISSTSRVRAGAIVVAALAAGCGGGQATKVVLRISAPKDLTTVQTHSVEVRGTVNPIGAKVTLLGNIQATIGPTGLFTATLPLNVGVNIVDVAAVVPGRARAGVSLTITRAPSAAETRAAAARATAAARVAAAGENAALAASQRQADTAGALARLKAARTGKTQAQADNSASLAEIASGRASGDYAVAQASGTVAGPSQIELRVSATPAQSATVSWTMLCAETGGGAGSKSGQSDRALPTTEILPLPAPSDSCDVAANAQITGSGKVLIAIYG